MKLRTWVKALSFLFTLLLLALVVPIAYLLISDPNDFKPQIQQLAQQQGLRLEIGGDLKWQIYPDIELEVSDLSVQGEQAGMDLDAQLGLARLQIELWPLFSGELRVRGIGVSDSRVGLTQLSSDSEVEAVAESQAGANSESTTASVQLISLTNIRLDYEDIEGVTMTVQLDELEIRQLDLSGGEFPVSLSLSYQSQNQSQNQSQIQLVTDATANVDLDSGNYLFSSESVNLWLDIAEQTFAISAQLESAVNLPANRWSLSLNQAQLEDLNVKANVSGGIEPLSALGQLELSGGDQLINKLTGQPLIKTLSLKSAIDYSVERLLINELVMAVNESQINAEAKYYFEADKSSEAHLSLDQINLDDYFPASEPGATSASPAENNSSAENPLAFLLYMPAISVQLDIGQLISSGLTVENIDLSMQVADSAATIELIAAELADGDVSANLVATVQQPQISVGSLILKQIDLSQIVLTEAGSPLISGIANLDFSGALDSLVGDAMLSGLNGNGQLSVENLSLATLNIEQSICTSAQQLGASAALREDWQSGTEFDQLASPYQIDGGLLSLQNIGSGFGNIRLSGGGNMNLQSMDFDAKFSLLIDGERTSEEGCSINHYLRNTALPLTCWGSLAEGGETSCGLDSSVIATLLAGQIKDQFGSKLNKLLGIDQSADESSDAIDGADEQEQTPSDQVEETVRNLLEGFLNR